MTTTWNDYRSWLGDELVGRWVDPKVTKPPTPQDISTDSRKIKRGDFYIPLRGESFDGHNFIRDALSKGASCFLYQTSHKANIDPTLQDQGIEVRDTLAALQKIAHGWRLKVAPDRVFAVTGSVGKTTVKELLAAICQQDGPTVFPEGSFNNEIGVPLTLLRVKEKTERLILEFGARHHGDIGFLCGLAEPTIACVLNVKHVHISEFGSIEGVFQTKTEMFTFSPTSACLVANADDEKILAAAKKTAKKVLSFGVSPAADVRVMKTDVNADGETYIEFRTPYGPLGVNINQSHESLAINAAAAVAMALAAGIKEDTIKAGLLRFSGAKGRFQILKTPKLTIIDDSYNASPTSMLAGFNTCAKLYPKATKVVVLGDMLELGADSPKLHYEVGKNCFDLLAPDLLITVGSESKEIARGALDAGLSKEKLLSFEDVGQAQRMPNRVFTKRDVVYVKGSRGIALDKLVDTLLKI